MKHIRIIDMENKKNILSLIEMQDLFCDYVFNKLSEQDRLKFEESLPNYPEMKKDIENVYTSFDLIEKRKLDNIISNHTRNISVKVNEKLYNQSNFDYAFNRLIKYLIPIGGLAVIVIIITYFNFFNNNIPLQNDNNTFSKITDKEINQLISDGITKENFLPTLNKLNYLPIHSNTDTYLNYSSVELINDLESIYQQLFSEQVLNDKITFTKFENTKQYDLFNKIENLDEDEIEQLLKELENEDFNT